MITERQLDDLLLRLRRNSDVLLTRLMREASDGRHSRADDDGEERRSGRFSRPAGR